MPPLNREAIVELRSSEDEVGGHEVVDCAHADDTNQHEPSTDIAEGPCDAARRKDSDPTILAASDWISVQVSRSIRTLP